MMIDYRSEDRKIGLSLPRWEFRETGESGMPLYGTEIKSSADARTEEERTIICRLCRHVITTPDTMVPMNGILNHIFTNPAGVTYTIACFSSARGCVTTGEPTLDYTWFPGFQWSYALCAGCFSHLGWHYRARESSFYGLILDRITENL